MERESRNCQNCKSDFIIEPEDFLFYEKIKVPPPTFCSECRRQRRLTFRNTHALYKRKDSFSGEDIISIYSPDKDLVVIDQKDWWGDGWDPFDYGMEYDFSKTFFQQWKELRDRIPMQSMSNSKAINSDYCNVAEESYDSYLVSASWKIERTMYSDAVSNIKDSLDLHIMHRSDFCYEDVNCSDSYKLFYSQDSHSCVDSYFLYDCRGCTNCYMSSNLRNKSYYFNNQQLNKEQYEKQMANIDLSSYQVLLKEKSKFSELKLQSLHRFAHFVNCFNVSGDNLENAKNSFNCFYCSGGLEDSSDLFWTLGVKDCFSCGPGIGGGELFYETFDAGAGGKNCSFCSVVYYSNDVSYSFNSYNCSNVFGCIGLRSKKYCILNKQYTKEEYEKLLPQVKKHMIDVPYVDVIGRIYKYGEFFPAELSPFCYNETVAQDYYPLTKEQSIEHGFSWKNPDIKGYTPTLKTSDLPDNISEVSDDILKEIIECEHKGECNDKCATAFKIVSEELNFYRRFKIPLPRLCYSCRHYSRLNKRNPMKLWHRQCMCELPNHTHEGKCAVEFETSYAPERPEKVYCEKCYQAEVI
jgi:hypothetical protein